MPLPALVEPIPGEPLRFHVRSRERANIKHTVDLQEHGFNGECSCENFQFVQLKKLRQDKRDRVLKIRRCFHIVRAYEFYAAVKARMEAMHFYKQQQTEADNDYQPEKRGGRSYQLNDRKYGDRPHR